MDSEHLTVSRKIETKKNRILHLVRKTGGLGRLDIARKLPMSNSRVCDLVQELLDARMIEEDVTGRERRGRRSIPITLNREFAQWIGIDVEAKHLRIVLCDFAGGVLWKSEESLTLAARGDPDAALRQFIRRTIGKARSLSPNLLGAGVAAPGVIDYERGIILEYHMMPQLQNFAIRDIVADETNLPCTVEGNIRALALAEHLQGSARHLHTFVCVGIRSGLGAAIFVNGDILGGSHGFAGEAGHMIVAMTANPSKWKQLQDLVSEEALDGGQDGESPSLPPELAVRAGELLGAHVASIAALLDPQAIILAGNLMRPEGQLWGPMAKTYQRCISRPLADRVHLLPAQLGPYAAAMGASMRCFQVFYPESIGQDMRPVVASNEDLRPA